MVLFVVEVQEWKWKRLKIIFTFIWKCTITTIQPSITRTKTSKNQFLSTKCPFCHTQKPFYPPSLLHMINACSTQVHIWIINQYWSNDWMNTVDISMDSKHLGAWETQRWINDDPLHCPESTRTRQFTNWTRIKPKPYFNYLLV